MQRKSILNVLSVVLAIKCLCTQLCLFNLINCEPSACENT